MKKSLAVLATSALLALAPAASASAATWTNPFTGSGTSVGQTRGHLPTTGRVVGQHRGHLSTKVKGWTNPFAGKGKAAGTTRGSL